MALRVARGLFRLWVVGTAVFVIAIATVSYDDIKAGFDAATSKPVEFRIVPQDEDPSQHSGGQRVEIKGSGVIVEFPAGTTPAEELRALRARFGGGPNPWVEAWAKVGLVAGIALGIPLVVLILGASLVWAFSGFAATRP
jgi:hypothetical protein